VKSKHKATRRRARKKKREYINTAGQKKAKYSPDYIRKK